MRGRDISYPERFEFNLLYFTLLDMGMSWYWTQYPTKAWAWAINFLSLMNCIFLVLRSRYSSPQIFQLYMHHYLRHKHLSPIIHTRTCSIFKMMESSTISYNYLHIVNPGDQFSYPVAIITHPKVLKHSNWHVRFWV